MRPRTLIGLMFCTLFSLSAPAFAQTAQPVIQTAQAARSDVTIPEGTTQEFDAAQGEIKFDGTLTNKGTIIITSSDPAQTEAFLRAVKLDNQGTIISQVPSLTIYTEKVYGAGEVTAPENIAIAAADKDLLIANGIYRAKYFRPSAERKLSINARRIDAQVDLKAYELSIGVREGNLDIIQQKVDGDPIYYNRGGDITAVMPGNGFDIYVLAAGNVTLSGVNAIGLNGEVRDFVVSAGLHFANPVDDGNSEFGCGGFGGVSCAQTIQDNSGPGQIFEGAPGGPFEPSGTITINGAIARGISLGARDIVINGTLDARQDNTRPGSPSIILTAANSITVNAQLKTEATKDQLKEGFVALQAPTINVNSKITSDSVFIAAFENSVATTGSITTAAIEARTSYIHINGGHIQFADVGGALTGGAVLPLSQPHDSGEFTIKTGKLTAHRYVLLAATGNIDAGNIELLPNESPVPLGAHDVRIHANVGKEDAPPLKIGGGTNGAASITVQGTTDLGPGLTQKTGKIFLTNGPSGDIVLDGAKIHVTNEHDGTPSLIASAGTGQVTVKGNIVFDGTATAPAGQILLVGDEIRSTGATISVKDTLADAAERPAKVILATSKLTLAGDLTIEANSKALTSVKVLPKGSIFVDPQDYSESLPHFVDNFPVNVTEDEVLVGGSANLTIKTKSDGAKVEITAKPLKFNNGTSLIAATGTGSQINVDYPGSPSAQNSLIFNGGGVTFDTSNPNGDAGDINILADKVRNAADAVVSLKANADSNGKGGNITISMDRGTLALGSEAGAMSLTAGGNNGNGGTVTIMNNIHNGRVTYQNSATGPAIDVSAVGSSGDGGTVTIESDILADDDGIVAVAALAGPGEVFVARGAGSGKGGKLTLKQKIVNFAGQINAPSAANGNGGEIEIAATVSMVLGTADNPAVLTADGSGSGKGGKIKITAPSGFSVDLKNASISAKGGDNGEGGEVIVSGTAPFNVNKVINVDGGNGIGTGDFDGSISLTGILCQQWKTGFAFPSEYWNCVNPGNPSPSDKIPAQIASNLPNGIPTTIKNAQNVELYVMEDPSQFSVFFASSLDAHIAGYTFSFRNTDGLYEQPFYTTIFENTTLTRSGYVSVPDDWLKENTTHEMGHQLDVARGSESADAIFEQISADFLFLDTLGNGQPCTIGVDAGQGPFVGVVDSLTGQPFCDNGQLVNPNNYSGLTNHEIAQKSSQNLNQVLLLGEISWAEPYAHAFAFQGFSKNIPFPPGYYDPTAEGLFAKGYFTCTQSHVATLLGTNFTKVYDYPCVVPAP